MMSKWIGYAVSVNCGEPLGCYQGTILEADGTTITLTKAFRNGFPYPKSQVTLNAADIKDLKIIEGRSEPSEQTHSTVAVSKSSKKSQRATVCENLQATPSSSVTQSVSNSVSGGSRAASARPPPPALHAPLAPHAPAAPPAPPARSKPIDIQGGRNIKINNHAGSYSNAGSTPKARGGGGISAGGGGHEKARRRNEACFGEAAEPALDDDFDFEGNLALFDKRALWEEMRHSHKPDLVRHAGDEPVSFRHDENVLGAGGAGAGGAARRAIRVPDELRGALDYVTDEGVVVPSVVPRLRARLWRALQHHELADCAYTLLARAAADVALRLVGGERRLEPRNAHQPPTVVALVGAHRAGAAGLLAARLLASHGARAAYLVSGAGPGTGAGARGAALEREVAALALSGVHEARAPSSLPGADVVLLALHDPAAEGADGEEAEGEGAEDGAHGAALGWARGARAALVALEPPARGWARLGARASVVGVAPGALCRALGRVYLADVAPPLHVFAEQRLAYRPPFGASSVLALHPADD